MANIENSAIDGGAPSEPSSQDALDMAAHLLSLAQLMDSQFRVPFIPTRLGLDTIIGLIPGIGDTLTAGVSGYIWLQGARLGLPKRKLARMGGNIFIDWLIGLIPLIGDIFDWGWKANNRNAAIIAQWVEQKHGPSAQFPQHKK